MQEVNTIYDVMGINAYFSKRNSDGGILKYIPFLPMYKDNVVSTNKVDNFKNIST